MDIDRYFEIMEWLTQEALATTDSVQDFMESLALKSDIVNKAIDIRAAHLIEEERLATQGYLAVGYFQHLNSDKRIAAFIITFEIIDRKRYSDVTTHCRPYDAEQPLFIGDRSLLEHIRTRKNGTPDNELIDLPAIASISGSEIYKTPNGFAKLSPHLNPGIVNWIQNVWPDAPTYVRLDPDAFDTSQPNINLFESVLVPSDPTWLRDFHLRKGMKKFASYKLEDADPSASHQQYIEYHGHFLRRLEIRAERRNDDYLTMMIEELPRHDDPNEIMIGRCIHLDTRNQFGTSFGDVTLQHLDLALNVYRKEERATRFGQSLQNGMVQDAPCRTHLFRVEEIPMWALFPICSMFLKSKFLLNEWWSELKMS